MADEDAPQSRRWRVGWTERKLHRPSGRALPTPIQAGSGPASDCRSRPVPDARAYALRATLEPVQDTTLWSLLVEIMEHDTQKHIADGLSPGDARKRALARFGPVALAADQCRDARGIGFVDELTRDVADIEPDVWTSVPGSSATLLGRSDGTLAIALIRGTLPPIDWPAEKGEVLIDGTRAVVGPHPDGTWVSGWFEAPGERCDLYTMVFYPPIAPEEVEQVIDGMNRVGG